MRWSVSLQILLGETLPKPAVAVVGQGQVPLEVGVGLLVGLLAVLGEDSALLDDQRRLGSEDLPRASGVVGSAQVGVRSVGAVAGQIMHPGTERGEQAWGRGS